jgi:putative SOS response-associated peptidase YedK
VCGRFGLATTASELAELLEIDPARCQVAPRHNIAPTQAVLGLRLGREGRELAAFHWGLIPHWAASASESPKRINARSETAHQKPAFRDAFAHRRCLIAADGFFEWRQVGRNRDPLWFRLRSGRPFAMAGLWERWRDLDGSPIESCALLTTAPNPLVAPIHDRMPVILRREHHASWLDTRLGADELGAVLSTYPAAEMDAIPVERYVNDPRHEGPLCRAPKPTLPW